jgi:TolB protein
MRFQRLFLACAVALAIYTPARAQLTVEITGAGANRLPVAIAEFTGERIVGQALTSVVRADLERSGLFRLVDAGVPLADNATPPYADLKTRGADVVAGGSVATAADGRHETRVRLSDVQKQATLGNPAYLHTGAQLRATAHRIADFIYEKLTGEPGVFSTRIAYVVKSTGRYELKIADADGANDQAALASREPIISPAWSPDGTKLAYVSFEAKKPVVYVHDLASGRRHVAANFKGSNSAPAWSPDGKQLAVVLTKDGTSQLYVVNADGSGVRRIATSSGIDTEPRWAPDGQYIYFTSDRGGSPQIYRTCQQRRQCRARHLRGQLQRHAAPLAGWQEHGLHHPEQRTFPAGADGPGEQADQILTDSTKDESPSFAPNGRMILYATEIGGRGVLAAVSSDGRVKQKLSVQAADVREPAWGPLVR